MIPDWHGANAPAGFDATIRADPAAMDHVLQRVLLDRPVALRPLYWRMSRGTPDFRPLGTDAAGALAIPAGATLSLDAYFNAFWEENWRLHAAPGEVALRLDLSGPCTVRIIRRTHDRDAVVAEERVTGDGPVRLAIPDTAINFRQHGMLVAEVTAHAPVTLRGGAWVTAAPPRRIGLAAVFCTFNREADIAAVLASLAAEAPVLDRLARVIVVNQGRPGLARHPAVALLLPRLGHRLRIVEQANFGGAGGFGRGLLEALDDPDATHAVLLDDDLRIEPDTLLRMAAFFAHATADRPVGGPMLDLVQPHRIYESGAVIREANWSFYPQHHGLDVADRNHLPRLLGPAAVHYGGWWCLGVPLALVRAEGMPLPVFIRGDDVEFGLRLAGGGYPTLPMPGLGVWHEPFYLKLGGWQLYYETRNMLITASSHLDPGGRVMAARMARALLVHLLTFRYYEAALILRAVADFLAGPAILDEAPGERHAALAAVRARFPGETVAREIVLPDQPVRPAPRGRVPWGAALARSLLDSALRPTVPGATPCRVDPADFGWSRLRRADAVALATWWDRSLPVYRRSRESFRALVREAAPLLLRLHREGPAIAARWREAFPRHTSVAFWRRYLGLGSPGPTPVRDAAPEGARATVTATGRTEPAERTRATA